jgi:predicted MPP superfamily phosphohydrolase
MTSARRAPGPLVTLRSRALVARHRVESPNWRAAPLRIVFLSDFHCAAPWTTESHLARIVEQSMEEKPDLAILGGDFLAGPLPPGRRIAPERTIDVLMHLVAPLGTFAILGNHDWKDCPLAKATACVRNSVVDAVSESPIQLLRNDATPLGDTGAWLVGFDSQQPFGRRGTRLAFHDPNRAFSKVPDGVPAILAAHEPDWFASRDPRAVLQVSGHTHGGQANLFGWRPLTPSRYRGRYGWGHFQDGDRHMVVSGGIGYSGAPLRIAAPPEITIIELSSPHAE